MIEEKKFREDLFYRLNVMPIFLPPLRERIGDIENFIQHFVVKLNKKLKKEIKGFAPEAIEILKSYPWPGNIRELENTIERIFILTSRDWITTQDIPENIAHNQKTEINIDSSTTYNGPLQFDIFKEEMEKEFILAALKANNGRINKTVATANIPKNTLLRKIKKYNIDVKNLES
jgi:transcriptional regulator with PAS, ATPase and Fis domain